MQTALAPVHRVRFPAEDGRYLTPLGWRLARLLFSARRSVPFVTMRRYLVVKLERDRMIHDLHMMAVALNKAEAQLRCKKAEAK